MAPSIKGIRGSMPRAARDLHPELRWNLPASRERVSFESARIENLEREAARPLRAGGTRELEDSLVPRPHRNQVRWARRE